VANNGGGTVSVINTTNNTVIKTISVGSAPYGVAFSSSNADIYVANNGAGTVSVISTSSNTVIAIISVGNTPSGIAFAPFNADIFVANNGAGTVSVIGTLSNTVIGTATVGSAPYEVAFASSNSNIYVTNYGSNSVSVIPLIDSISISPISATWDVSQSNTFTATPSGGSGNYTGYQWYVNGTAQIGQTASSFSYSPASSGSYLISATVTDSWGTTSARSTVASVKVNSALLAPIASVTNGTVDQGQTSNLTSTTVSTGTSPYKFQWLQKAPSAGVYSPIVGATSSIYSFVTSGSTTSGIWSFELQVTDNASTPSVVTSTPASVTVNVAPSVIDHFQFDAIGSQIIGTAFGISITAKDSNNNTVTSYAGTNTLAISSGTISPANTGVFSAGLWTGQITLSQSGTNINISTSGAGKSGTSNQFIVSNPPQPLSASASPPTLSVNTGQAATFTASASGGSPSYSFQWFEGSNAIAGQATLSVTKSTAGTFSFYCKVTDSASATINTNTVTLTVTSPPPPPTLTAYATPKTATATTGQSSTFTASASGGALPYNFVWYEGSAAITGETKPTLNITKNTEGSYTFYCKITDLAGATANTNTVTMTITSPPSAPTIELTSSVANGSKVESSSLQISWRATDASSTVDHYEVELDSEIWVNIGLQTNYTFNGLSNGSHVFYVKAVGTSGLNQINSINVIVNPAKSESPIPLVYVAVVIAIIVAITIGLLLFLKFFKKKPKLAVPAQLTATAEPNSLVADGFARSVITLQLLDKNGKPIAALADTPIRVNASRGKVENSVVTIPKGKDAEKTVLISSTETGPAPVSVNAEGLKSITITLNFTERNRYCMHCGTQMSLKDKSCRNCGKSPPAGADTKACQSCQEVIPAVAKFCSECGAGQTV
jgi:YVTN family beta-propeller protein